MDLLDTNSVLNVASMEKVGSKKLSADTSRLYILSTYARSGAGIMNAILGLFDLSKNGRMIPPAEALTEAEALVLLTENFYSRVTGGANSLFSTMDEILGRLQYNFETWPESGFTRAKDDTERREALLREAKRVRGKLESIAGQAETDFDVAAKAEGFSFIRDR